MDQDAQSAGVIIHDADDPEVAGVIVHDADDEAVAMLDRDLVACV